MLLVRYFKYGFQIPKLLTHRGESLIKTLIYFLLIVSFMNFPLTVMGFQNEQQQINFIRENLTDGVPTWSNLPDGTMSKLTGFDSDYADGRYLTYKEYVFIFGYDEDIDYPSDKHQVIFYEDFIRYIDLEGNFLDSNGYYGFKTIFNLNDLNN